MKTCLIFVSIRTTFDLAHIRNKFPKSLSFFLELMSFSLSNEFFHLQFFSKMSKLEACFKPGIRLQSNMNNLTTLARALALF